MSEAARLQAELAAIAKLRAPEDLDELARRVRPLEAELTAHLAANPSQSLTLTLEALHRVRLLVDEAMRLRAEQRRGLS